MSNDYYYGAPEYVDVATRRGQFFAKYPMGSLQPLDPAHPYEIREMPDGDTFIVYAAAAYRYPGDPQPGVGIAWEPYPSKNELTLDSEMQTAETSAQGRAIVATGAAGAQRNATLEDVERREASRGLKQAGAVKQPAEAKRPSDADWRKLHAAAKRLDFAEEAMPILIQAHLGKTTKEVSPGELSEFRVWLVQHPDEARKLLDLVAPSVEAV